MQIFQQDYDNLAKLGEGAFGIAYKVKHKKSGSIYCAKVINTTYLKKKVKQNVLTQLSIMKQLKHPHIVTYIDSIVDQKYLIIIMEYCEHGDLEQHIKRRKQTSEHFTQNLIVNWLLQILNALVYVHDKKILHRDLKPANVFVDSNAFIKIGDFGVSKILDQTIHSNTYTGSPYYMSPEVHSSEKYTNKTDLWSLGGVIWAIASLSTPFKQKNLIETIKSINEGKIGSIPKIYSSKLQSIIKKLLTVNPEKRPSAKEMLFDQRIIDIMTSSVKDSQVNKSQLKQQFFQSIKQKQQNSIQSINLTKSQVLKSSYKEDNLLSLIEKARNQIQMKLKKMSKEGIKKQQITTYQKRVKKAFSDLVDKVEEGFKNLKKNNFNQTFNSSQNVSMISSLKSQLTINSVMLGQKTFKNMQNDKKRQMEESDLVFTQTINLDNTIQSKALDDRGLTIKENSLLGDTIRSQVLDDHGRTIKDQTQFSLGETLKSEMLDNFGNTMKTNKTLFKTVKSQFQSTDKCNPIQKQLAVIEAIGQQIKYSPSFLLDQSLEYTISHASTLNFTLLSAGFVSLKNQATFQDLPIQQSLDKNSISIQKLSKKSKQSSNSNEQQLDNTCYGTIDRDKQLQDILALYKCQLQKVQQPANKNKNYLVLSEIKQDIHENSMISNNNNSKMPSQVSIKNISTTSVKDRK